MVWRMGAYQYATYEPSLISLFYSPISILWGVSDAVRVRCTRGGYTVVVALTVSADLEAMCCFRLQKL